MAAQLRLVRQRIRSVKSIAKITRAQELIASSRIVKAQQRMRAAGPYSAELVRAVEAVVSRSGSINHPFTTERPAIKRAAVLILTSDGGFCGAYNANVLREAARLRQNLRERNVEPLLYVVGRKGIGWHRFRDLPLDTEWAGFSAQPQYQNAADVSEAILAAFAPEAHQAAQATQAGQAGQAAQGAHGAQDVPDDRRVDEVHLVSTEFVSMLTQRPTVTRLLPLEIVETTEQPASGPLPQYEFEPSPEKVLDALLPQYVASRVYFAMLAAAAAELASRRKAMKAATDNANDLLGNLTREANNARQAEITQEISEIVGGANALAGATSGRE